MSRFPQLLITVVTCVLLFGNFFYAITGEFIYTSTSTTEQPTFITGGLSLPLRNVHPPKCKKEIPAVFFQYEKDVLVVGNSSLNRYFNVIETCCSGYKRYEYDWSQCVPDCGKKCLKNGFCLAEGHCQCFGEFVLNHRNDCVETCPLGCPNGQCYLNGTCVCNEGYELDGSRKFCLPICESGCGHNEICNEPNQCVCTDGYFKTTPDILRMGCQPICIPDCGFGHCIGPNVCECFHGYEKRENSSVCESNCYMRCENGFCVNRTTCICHNGFKYDYNTTSCLPDCGDDCENGICRAPGICRCFNGYRKEGNKCVANCEYGCGFYGKCVAPEVCGCAIINGPQRLYQYCALGYCNARGRCRCHSGTTRFINQCLSPDKVTSYAAMHHEQLNDALFREFDLLIGRHFHFLDFHRSLQFKYS